MHARGRFEQCPSAQIEGYALIFLVKAPQNEHDGPMGEKPLSIDEAPAQARTIGAPGPLGGVDTPPPGMAADLINTTRSDIKSSGSVAAPPPIDGGGGGPVDGEPDDAPPPGSGESLVVTTRSNIKNSGSVAGGRSGSGESDTEGPSDPPGLAIKENGIKYGDGGGASADGTSGASIGPDKPGPTDPGDPFPADPSPGGGAGNIAGGSQPIPGVDILPGKKRSGAAAATGPVRPEPTRPADPFPADGGPAGLAVKEQGVRYGEEATGPVDSPGVAAAAATRPGTAGDAGDAVEGQGLSLGMETLGAARAGDPVPELDVKLGRNPGGVGNSDWRPSPDPGPGPSPDRKPIPGIDDAAEKKKA